MRYAAITERLAGTGGARWAVHFRAREMRAAGEEVIALTIGEPDSPPEPTVIEACIAALRAGRTRYSSGPGEMVLRKAVAARYAARRPGVTAANVICLAGTQTALYAAMQALCDPGDGVLVGDPFYATYDGVIAAPGARRISVPLRPERGFRMAAADLDATVAPEARVLLLNSPHNPTGAVLSARDVAEIGEVARARDLWIVADEVYRDLVFQGEAPSPFDDPALAERVIAASSISKSYAAPGFRSGWLVGPEEFIGRLLPVVEAMLFGGPPFIADATAAALAADPAVAGEMRAAYARRAGMIADTLGQLPGLVVHRPQAGMFVVIDVAGTGLDGDCFAWGLLETQRVAVMPGAGFGDTARNLIRMSVTEPDAVIAEACRRIAAFMRARDGGCNPR